ncbi:hypothetical protein Q3G72_027035 [Acer saccharum]|nr:hypothetical protein Q3G72_027035 [Acer saccharum]
MLLLAIHVHVQPFPQNLLKFHRFRTFSNSYAPLNELYLTVPQKARFYHYHIPVFIWCEDQISQHMSEFKDGEDIPPLVVVLFEGWMLGFKPLPMEVVKSVDPQLETVSKNLEAYYDAWDKFIMAWIVIKIKDPSCV